MNAKELDNLRGAEAHMRLAEFEFGEDIVKDTGTWQHDGDEWSLPIYLERDDGPSRKVTLVVCFKPGSEDVLYTYVAG